MTYDTWRAAAAKYLFDKLSITDLLDPADPYKVADNMEDAYKEGVTPEVFIRDAFSEEIARRECEEQLAAESLEYESGDLGEESTPDLEDEEGPMTGEIICRTERLKELLQRISYAPNNAGMAWGWTVRDIYSLDDQGDVHHEGWLVSNTFQRPDRDTGTVGRGQGREWFIKNGETVSGVVKTCFAASKMIVEHEVMEAFLFDGARPFDPHNSVDDLISIKTRKEDGSV